MCTLNSENFALANDQSSFGLPRQAYFAAAVLLAFALLFAGVLAAYVYRFEKQLTEENRVRLAEVSSYIAAHMTTVVNDTLESLRAVSGALVLLDSEKSRMAYLEQIAEQYGFVYVGYAGEDGMLRATVPSESGEIRNAPYFNNALAGKSTVSDQFRKIFTNRAVSGILLAVPLERNGTPAGVLMAMKETKSLRKSLSLENFGGHGYSYIIDKNGAVIMRTKSMDFGNLFAMWRNVPFRSGYSLERFKSDVLADRNSLTEFDNALGVTQYAYSRPLPFNGWTLINVVSKQAVAEKTSSLTRELAYMCGGLVLFFMGLMFCAMRSYRLSRESRAAAEAKSAFLANMSHEIRTPMNAIVGLSEIMLRDDLSSRHRDQVTRILNSGKGLLTIINDILDISKMESGSFSIAEEVYELESLLYDLTVIAAIRIGDKPVDFLVSPASGVPYYLVGDMSRVKQILLNIVGNAVKFTERGQIRLSISCEKQNDAWLMRVEVRDTGVGIRKDDLARLFTRYAQVDTKRNRNIEGTGLGLTISRTLSEMMGGGIAVQSEYGQGSVFTITLVQGVAEDPSPLTPALVRQDIRLLICEESPDLRDFETSCLNGLSVAYDMCEDFETFARQLSRGGYTHALAARSLIDRLPEPPDLAEPAKTTRLVALLGMREHSLIDIANGNVYLPLLSSQLASLLNGQTEGSHAPKLAGADTDVIEPMPHVSVLIVDDNELNIMVAEGLMAPYGMLIHQACSGKEAIHAVLNKDYDLVLMDHMMPEMDGVETTHLIRSLPGEKYRELPIVALTANTTTEARQLFMDNGFSGFLAKPIEIKKLNGVLREWLKEVNERRAAEAEA